MRTVRLVMRILDAGHRLYRAVFEQESVDKASVIGVGFRSLNEALDGAILITREMTDEIFCFLLASRQKGSASERSEHGGHLVVAHLDIVSMEWSIGQTENGLPVVNNERVHHDGVRCCQIESLETGRGHFI